MWIKIIGYNAVIVHMMLSNLVEIQQQLDKRRAPPSSLASAGTDDEDLETCTSSDWLASPADAHRFHSDYTTIQWLKVFRSVR